MGSAISKKAAIDLRDSVVDTFLVRGIALLIIERA